MSEYTVRLTAAGKMYRRHASLAERLLDAAGLAGRIPGLRPRWTEFWALRGIDLELPAGARIGVIGRNGAGKSTLLKLITGHLSPTEGAVDVRGPTLSLGDPAGGVHPELSGADNVRLALTYRGLAPRAIEAALREIADFAELGDVLHEPFGTYSSGMKARLGFAAATSVAAPRVLVIDEVLGAGDAYFVNKSSERMARLVASGATIVLVSHALEQVLRLCDQALWLDRGRIVARGPCLEVVKAYQQFVRVLEDRRLRERNRRPGSGTPLERVLCRLRVEGAPGAAADVREVALFVGEREEALRLGEAQDTAAGHESRLLLEQSLWSEPRSGPEGRWRSLRVEAAGQVAAGLVEFRLDPADARKDHAVEIHYRPSGHARLVLQVEAAGQVLTRGELASEDPGWRRQRLPLGPLAMTDRVGVETGYVSGGVGTPSRWPGQGDLAIEDVRLLGEDGCERATYEVGSRLTIEVTVAARRAGSIDWLPVAVVYRRDDGLLVSRYVGSRETTVFRPGDKAKAILAVAPLQLGNGHYVVSISLHGRFDVEGLEAPTTYDLVDRSYEFVVSGTPPLLDGVFVPSDRWQIVPS